MFKKLASVYFIFFIAIFTSSSFAKPYSDIYIFGDSLSDMGNAAAAVGTNLPSPPYFQNRVTNGRVAVEALANKLGLKTEPSLYFLGIEAGTNYAVAGASASESGQFPAPENLLSQTGAFLALNMWDAPADALYVVFIGGNDVRDARGELDPFDPTNLADAYALLDEAVFNIGAAVQSLIAYGATHILVVNSPNVGAIPETSIAAAAYNLPWLPQVTEGLAVYFNTTLGFAMNLVEFNTGNPIIQFDLFSRFNYLLDNPSLLDITNTTDPCYLSSGNELFPVLNPLCLDQNLEADPNSFFYIDEIHPTKNVHKAFGKAMARQILFGTP